MDLTSIIIVNWNTAGMLQQCVRKVRRFTNIPHELLIVDNGSQDSSPKISRQLENANTKAILLEQNLGFAAGANRGIGLAQGRQVCLLNTDAFVTSGWLQSLCRCLKDHQAGLVGPCTNRAKGTQRFRPWLGLFPPANRPTCQVDYLSFFCVLADRKALDQVGSLDERFGAGTFEDDDYCRRAVAGGFRLMVDGQSWVWHEGHATFKANGLCEKAIRRANQNLFQSKWEKPSAISNNPQIRK